MALINAARSRHQTKVAVGGIDPRRDAGGVGDRPNFQHAILKTRRSAAIYLRARTKGAALDDAAQVGRTRCGGKDAPAAVFDEIAVFNVSLDGGAVATASYSIRCVVVAITVVEYGVAVPGNEEAV